MKALVIEDDTFVAKLFSTWLEACGYTVTVAENFADGMKVIAEAPDLKLITLDLNLPDSTYEFTIPKIKSIRESNPDALLVVISGVITHNDEKFVLSMGADAMIEKHEVVTEKTFMGKIRDVLSALTKTPTGFQNRAKMLEGLAVGVAKRCNTIGCNIGESLLNLDPGTTGFDSGVRQAPKKEHIDIRTP